MYRTQNGLKTALLLGLLSALIVGISAIWIASLVAVRRQRSAYGLDAAHQHGAQE